MEGVGEDSRPNEVEVVGGAVVAPGTGRPACGLARRREGRSRASRTGARRLPRARSGCTVCPRCRAGRSRRLPVDLGVSAAALLVGHRPRRRRRTRERGRARSGRAAASFPKPASGPIVPGPKRIGRCSGLACGSRYFASAADEHDAGEVVVAERGVADVGRDENLVASSRPATTASA